MNGKLRYKKVKLVKIIDTGKGIIDNADFIVELKHHSKNPHKRKKEISKTKRWTALRTKGIRNF